MELKRNCPDCGREIVYSSTNVYHFKQACIKNSKCTSCRSRRYPIEKEYKRNCPSCGREIQYHDRGTRDGAETGNKVCKFCRLKWQDRYGERNIYKYYTFCRCGRKKLHKTKNPESELRVKFIIENDKHLCKSCSNTLYYTPGADKINTKPERETEFILLDNKIKYSKQYKVCGKNYDFYLPKYNLLVEVDGTYWHGKGLLDDQLNKQQQTTRLNDIKKNKIAKENNYNLLRIWSDELEHLIPKIKKLCLKEKKIASGLKNTGQTH